MYKNIINKIKVFNNNNDLKNKLFIFKFIIKNKLSKKNLLNINDLYKLLLLLISIYNIYISIKNNKNIFKYNINNINIIIKNIYKEKYNE